MHSVLLAFFLFAYIYAALALQKFAWTNENSRRGWPAYVYSERGFLCVPLTRLLISRERGLYSLSLSLCSLAITLSDFLVLSNRQILHGG